MPSPKNSANHKASDSVRDAAMQETSAVLQRLCTSLSGLSEVEAATRLEEYGLNEVASEKKRDWLWRLWIAARNPLVILLTILAAVTFATAKSPSDMIGGWVMLAMVALGLSLRFIQETKADNAAAKLKAMIKVTATVIARRPVEGNPHQPTCARRRGETFRRRHDSRRRPADFRQGFVHHSSHADR